MTKRLQCIIDMIDPGGRGVVDVGTDHGFVPVRLALSGYPGTIIASDVNRDPLSAAVRYAEEMNVADQIDFRLSDGLQGCCFQEVDTVVIAGMGGDLICSILDEAGAFHRSDIVFILQPMTKIEILRYFLVNNGWVISEESTVSENGKLFHILKANYQGLLLRTDSYRNPFLEDWELYTGKEELLCKSSFCTETLLQSRRILEKRLYGKDAAYFQSIFDNLKMMMERTSYGGSVMIQTNDLFQYINSYAPVETQMDFDNAGFLFGSKESAVHSVLLALDATNAVIEEAAQKKVQVLITHHPVIFHPVKSILTNDVTGRKLLLLAKNDISVISMHTNLDAAEGGVNDVLIRKLGAVTVSRSEEEPMMRIGELNEPTSLSDYLHYVKTSLHCNGIRYVDSGKPVRRIACLGGAGGEMLSAALHAGCDTFVTGDVDYHTFLDAAELGVNLIDADHFCTENPVMVDLQSRLEQAFPEVQFILSEIHRQTTQFYM